MTVHERLRRMRKFFECLTRSDASVLAVCDWDMVTITVLVPVDWERMAVPGMIHRVDDVWGSDLGRSGDLESALCMAEIFLRGPVDSDQLRDLLKVLACNAPVASEPDAPL